MRNYGMLVNNIGGIGSKDAPSGNPYAVGEVQVSALVPELAPATDPYFRGYDNNYLDLWRHQEWKREFDQFVAQDSLLDRPATGHSSQKPPPDRLPKPQRPDPPDNWADRRLCWALP